MFKSRSALTPEEDEKLRIILGLSARLERAYNLKNDFLEFMHSRDSSVGRERLSEWLYYAEKPDMPEFEACTKAMHHWSEYILNAFDCTYTNGFTEGCNNKTKVLKRACYGVRNFARFRNRILHCTARA